eukprot:CAMPEP_0184308744 /NCGR_PEP_ID=MMETSP1049-20130417/17111_1 /TAXON_ID=77928 /ORGANISM="Proteomonas sulcata, Strain CCMP704" /LENGTH=347 /DNA_ID=CAMNT_0026621483 /DNA_START=85 /DNA_END=1128 /DNA_ORIENTATION=+
MIVRHDASALEGLHADCDEFWVAAHEGQLRYQSRILLVSSDYFYSVKHAIEQSNSCASFASVRVSDGAGEEFASEFCGHEMAVQIEDMVAFPDLTSASVLSSRPSSEAWSVVDVEEGLDGFVEVEEDDDFEKPDALEHVCDAISEHSQCLDARIIPKPRVLDYKKALMKCLDTLIEQPAKDTTKDPCPQPAIADQEERNSHLDRRIQTGAEVFGQASMEGTDASGEAEWPRVPADGDDCSFCDSSEDLEYEARGLEKRSIGVWKKTRRVEGVRKICWIKRSREFDRMRSAGASVRLANVDKQSGMVNLLDWKLMPASLTGRHHGDSLRPADIGSKPLVWWDGKSPIQ